MGGPSARSLRANRPHAAPGGRSARSRGVEAAGKCEAGKMCNMKVTFLGEGPHASTAGDRPPVASGLGRRAQRLWFWAGRLRVAPRTAFLGPRFLSSLREPLLGHACPRLSHVTLAWGRAQGRWSRLGGNPRQAGRRNCSAVSWTR